MYPLSELPQRLRAERRKQRKRQEDVAARLDVSREVLSRYENGKLNLSIDRAERLAEQLGCRVVWRFEPIDEEELDVSV